MGTDHSGEDIESGRVNRADDRTIIWGQNGDDGVDFNGPAIFMVERAGDPVEDVDYSEPDGWVPDRALDAILGIGSSGRNIGTTVGGIGVTGRGGDRQGTGVLGIGGSAGNDGGIGAHGVGGAGPHGSGLVGQGGRRDLAGRDPYGTGVVGVGGGADRPLPPSTDTAGAGVFGRGADVVTADLHGDPVGPEAPGAGVSGRGGVMDSPRPLNAAGVIGVAGGYPNPPEYTGPARSASAATACRWASTAPPIPARGCMATRRPGPASTGTPSAAAGAVSRPTRRPRSSSCRYVPATRYPKAGGARRCRATAWVAT
jgi:hypothetical protein